ncbi:endonuclease domain-containing protein [Monashia sp. NPDC004114]
MKTVPPLPEVTVPAGRKITVDARARARIHSSRIAVHDAEAGVTSPLRTVIDCARSFPLDEALAIADSALRHRAVRPSDLARAMAEVKGPGRPKVLRVLAHASARAANPFESVLRAISLDVAGLRLRPQVGIVVAGQRVVPDLVDVDLGLVVEADSHEFHTNRRQIAADCWRYDELVLGRWRVFRFAYEQVMFDQEWVRSVLCRASQAART